MNISDVLGPVRIRAFRCRRRLMGFVPGGRLRSVGARPEQINAVIIINLDRQPKRLRLVRRELARFRTADGVRLDSLAQRFTAVDARDGRAVAATADVDTKYLVADQMYVQPDPRLAASFDPSTPVRMTRQEVAVARSHIETWKRIARGDESHVLVLEDDVWFRRGARKAIDRGWQAAGAASPRGQGPNLIYLSYVDADPSLRSHHPSDAVFQPSRGLWFLSGYVLSRKAARHLLGSMPVVGPVDLWMNFRLTELDAWALSSPALAQRPDAPSDNAYSILPFLARAGVVDAHREVRHPGPPPTGPVLGWTTASEFESLAMALSMLGLRVRVFDHDDDPLDAAALREVFETFDAVIDPPISADVAGQVAQADGAVLIVEYGAELPHGLGAEAVASCTPVVMPAMHESRQWAELCAALRVEAPVNPFPVGAPRNFRAFRVGRSAAWVRAAAVRPTTDRMHVAQGLDDSPWVLPASHQWLPALKRREASPSGGCRTSGSMSERPPVMEPLVETFPGNLASFVEENLRHDVDGAHLRLTAAGDGPRPYRSAAIASPRSFSHGRFEATIKPARGAGIVTGFFLHRAMPRQEIDIEFLGADTRRMLTNIYYNPGDDGAAMSFGYRGTPCWIELGFDAADACHTYAIDWRFNCVSWLVDGVVVHQRASWDPTPVPHLPLRLHMNVWTPRSRELAGRIYRRDLPAEAVVRDIRVTD